MELEKYKWVNISGNARTPQRFWNRTYITDEEYAKVPEECKKNYRALTQADKDFLANNRMIETC